MANGRLKNPFWTLVAPLLALGCWGLLTSGVLPSDSRITEAALALLLGISVFASVHHAEVIAARVGEPFGSIVLAIAITVIEVGLILTLMLAAPDGGPNIARDTVFAAVMIIISGVVGLCILLGSRKHFEQTLRVRGTASALAALATLATITLILPNYTISAPGPAYSQTQLAMIALLSLVLYGTFLFVQTVRHRDFFLPPTDEEATEDHSEHAMPADGVAIASAVFLCASLVAVVLLAKALSLPLKDMIATAGLPQAFVGIIIATLVLLPESIAAARAAVANRLQTSMNLALGSGLASIGLSIPAVAVVAALSDYNVHLGISPSQTVLLALALFVSVLTLGNGRTNLLLGVIHLSIFGVFLVVSAIP